MRGAGGKDSRKKNTASFKPGNPGKPKGAVSFEKRKLAAACRELVYKNAPDHFQKLFEDKNPSVPLMKVRQDAIEWASDRGWGKAPQTINLGKGIDPNSPEGVLLQIAGQPIPQSSTESNDEESNGDGS